jgi:E3 ubiquitin-protein ligase HUWE1
MEVVQSIPNAIGALCLNQLGQEQFASRPSIIPGFFSIFTSEKHQRMLQEKENAVIIGTAVEELVRHHPTLKMQVFEAIKMTMGKIEELGNAYEVPEEHKQWYLLRPTKANSGPSSSTGAHGDDVDVEMGVAGASGSGTANAESEGTLHLHDDNSFKAHDNVIVSFIDVLGKVCLSL